MKSQIAVYGAGGHGKVVAEIISASGGTVNAFIDDNPALAGKSIAGQAQPEVDPRICGVVDEALGDLQLKTVTFHLHGVLLCSADVAA